MDGVVDIWDYFYRQNEVAYSHKVMFRSDSPRAFVEKALASSQNTPEGGNTL